MLTSAPFCFKNSFHRTASRDTPTAETASGRRADSGPILQIGLHVLHSSVRLPSRASGLTVVWNLYSDGFLRNPHL